MFHLLYGLWRQLFRKDEYRVLLVGLDNAGKTTILEKAKTLHGLPGLQPDKIAPTVGLNLGRIELRRCRLLLWDLGGQASLRPIWKKYFSQTHALVFVCDASLPADDPRWRDVRGCLRDTLATPSLGDVPVLILANKQDRHPCLAPQQLYDLLTDCADGAMPSPLVALSETARPRGAAGQPPPLSSELGAARYSTSPAGGRHSPRSGGPPTPAGAVVDGGGGGSRGGSPIASPTGTGSVSPGCAPGPPPSLSTLLDARAAYRVAPTCALDGSGVAEGLNWLVSFLLLKARVIDDTA